MKKVLLASVLALTLTTPLQAQQVQCGPRDNMVSYLEDTYNEVRQAEALSSNSLIMELYVNDDSGTWTVVYTLPDGNSCYVAHGTNFSFVEESLEPNL